MHNPLPDLTKAQFDRFARLIHELAHITLRDNKVTLLSNRLRKRLRALDLEDFEAYYDYLQNKMDEELPFFLEVINESYFWRTTQHFNLLKNEVLPRLLENHKGQNLKFWSAGCSTGEEPYNLAMELVEAMKSYGVYPFEVLATDISRRVVEFAKEGRYSGRKIDRVPPMILNRYFRPDDDKQDFYRVRDDIKARIKFGLANLFEVEVKPQHCIFCRNVMIYFKREDQETLVNKFHRLLLPGGFLIVGHSESLYTLETPFESMHFKEGIVYRRSPQAGDG